MGRVIIVGILSFWLMGYCADDDYLCKEKESLKQSEEGLKQQEPLNERAAPPSPTESETARINCDCYNDPSHCRCAPPTTHCNFNPRRGESFCCAENANGCSGAHSSWCCPQGSTCGPEEGQCRRWRSDPNRIE
jgi:hypothetical protein